LNLKCDILVSKVCFQIQLVPLQYGADETHNLYADTAVRGGNDNTFTRSAVAVEAPDHAKFPRFAEAKYLEAVLGPGDLLFMPKGMWHYVRSLTTSVSVNFWWS
jgi:hypothetical protein